MFAPQAQHGGLVKGFARGQVVGAAAVELAIGQAFTEVERIALDQETVADADVLATEREVDAILAEGLEQVAGAPAEVGVFDFGGALGTIAEACGIAVAPGS
ncbi:hypothetical protein D3C81_1470070 [compost metagenome]